MRLLLSLKKPIKVLLVEDDRECAMLVTTAAEMAQVPFAFSFATNGLEALDSLLQEGSYMGTPHPDLIILDLNLPILNGYELLREIDGRPELRKLPLVLLTTISTHDPFKKEFGLPDHCCHTKPDRFMDYVKLMRKIYELYESDGLCRVESVVS
jgi:CheY-like chemotaxis protein